MKAVQIKKFGGPEVLKTVSIEEPSPGDQEVKVKLYATGLNPNESYTITGTYGAFVPELPYIPGYDGAGVIEEIGSEVRDFKKGDRVWIAGFLADKNTGTYAEKVVIDVDHLYELPDNLSMLEAAGLGIPVFTAYRALFQRAKIEAGETILVQGGSGSVGSFAVQMAKAVGAKVIATSSTEEGRQKIIDLGADHALNHLSAKNQTDLMDLTDGNGPDVIIEMLANANLALDTEVIADEGRIVVVGSRDTIEINPRNVMGTEALITAVNVGRMTEAEKEEALIGINAFLQNKSVLPLIGKQFTLDEAKAAHKEMIEGSGQGRTVFLIDEE